MSTEDKSKPTVAATATEYLVSAKDKVVGAATDVAGAAQETGKSAGSGITHGADVTREYLQKTLPSKDEDKAKAKAAEEKKEAGSGVGGVVGGYVEKAKGLFK